MLRFVVALEAEAKPLIEAYRLQRDPQESAYKIFRRDATELIVSGIGKAAAASATAYLHLAGGGERHAVWLNVGIGGHGRMAVGEAVLAHKIRDRGSGAAWYPPLLSAPPCATDLVTTVDQPELAYESLGAFEMEASAFYPTACRFASAELVHCLKVVSDGPGEAIERLSLKKVSRLIDDQLPTVQAWVAACEPRSRELRQLETEPADLTACLARWRFTVAERHELRRQLRRRQTLAAGVELPLEDLDGDVRGKVVNQRLRTWLDTLPGI